MPTSNEQNLPLITICTVVFNREWIIKHMLASVQRQTYPHNKLFVVIVDGESKDKTAEVAKQTLDESDFSGYEVIVKKTNIPEARNLCIEHLRGDFLLFWDSDVIMEPTAVARMLETLHKENVDMVSSFVKEVTVDSVDEVTERWPEWETKYPSQNSSRITEIAGTSNILISKKVVEQVSFDPNLTFFEDQDFSSRATKLGFKILETKSIIGFDINSNKPFSSVYASDISLKEALRGIRKKGLIQAQNVIADNPSISKAVAKFFWANKRYLFYVGYVPAIALTVAGLLTLNWWLSLILPIYFLLYAMAQVSKKGLRRGLKAAVRSFIVGIPSTYSLLYFCIKISYKKPKGFTSKL